MSCFECFFNCFKNKYTHLEELESIVIVNNDKTIELQPLKVSSKISDSVLYDEEEVIYDSKSNTLIDKDLIKRNIKKEYESDSDNSWDESLL
tara:strand:+ start:2017 stop:2292 length:276 start_codon:yes stop_codon:yes gene_type:complete